MGRKRLSMGGNAILYQGRIFIKDGLDNDMTAKKRILAFEIGTFFTRYVVFEDGRMGIPGTIATPVDGEEPFYQALAHIVSKQRAPLDGIAISVPGFIDTEMTAVLPEDVKSQFIASIPAGRAGTPQDVAGVAAFLVSDDAAYLQGQVIAVDGGVTMQ